MMELLDARTLLFTGALIAGAFALVMFGIMRVHKTYPGYGRWALAEFTFTVLLLLQSVRGLVGDFLPIVLGNITACCAMILLSQGFHEFCGQRVRNLWVYIGSGACFYGIMYFYLYRDNLRIRSILLGFYLAVMATHAALPLLRRAPDGQRFGRYFAAVILLFGALIGVMRVVALALMTHMTNLFIRTPINTAFYLTDLMFIIGITFSFFVLTNERFVVDLRDTNIALEHEVKERHRAETDLRAEMQERIVLETKLRDLATIDSLTNVLNRRGLLRALESEIERADRYKTTLTVLALDLDHFKQINDTYGHAAGDYVLKFLGSTCMGILRAVDTIGRMGGDEFAVLLPATSMDDAMLVAERIRSAVEGRAVKDDEVSLFMTVSVGIALWTAGDDSGDLVLAQADHALYDAKREGWNCVRVA